MKGNGDVVLEYEKNAIRQQLLIVDELAGSFSGSVASDQVSFTFFEIPGQRGSDAPPRLPGLLDTEDPIAHEIDGHICGGKPDTRLISKVLSSFTTKFLNTDNSEKYLDK